MPVCSLPLTMPHPCDGESANRYDRVLAFNVLHLVEDLEATVEACASALRPGGLLISKTPCLREMNWLLPNVAVPLAQLVGMAPTVHNLSENDLRDSMRHQGLIVVSVERHGTRGQDVPDRLSSPENPLRPKRCSSEPVWPIGVVVPKRPPKRWPPRPPKPATHSPASRRPPGHPADRLRRASPDRTRCGRDR